MAKRRRVCALLVLVVVCAAPRVALGQLFAAPPQTPASSDIAVASDLYPTPNATPPPAVGCPDCGGWHGWGRRCGITGSNLFLKVPYHGGGMFKHSSIDGRDVGIGQPLRGTSWLNRPKYAGWFMGILNGGELIKNRVDQNTDLFGGYRFGWDFDHFWGAEARIGWAALNLTNIQGPPSTRTGDVIIADLNVLYYPWGDARWRPYCFMGMGGASFDFVDHNGRGHDDTLFGMPIGLGIKFLTDRRWLVLRAEIADNIAFGDGGLDTMQNVSFTLGVEAHYGARPKTYWPWHPNRHIW